MKNYLSFLIIIIFGSLTMKSYCQDQYIDFLFPAGSVCVGDVKEYALSGLMLGEHELSVSNGKFVVADSLYKTSNDSTKIILNCNYHEDVTIEWGTTEPMGTVYWHVPNQNNVIQEFPIGIVAIPTLYETANELIVENGEIIFSVKVKHRKYDETNFHKYASTNITYLNESVDSEPLEQGYNMVI